MAVTKIHAIKGTLKKALDYIMNEKKTDGKLLISSFGVSPETAYLEYQMTQETATVLNGAKRKRGDNLAHHLIQSFEPGESTPEQAHEIGQQLADKILGGNYEYVVATHIDKGHIHNHIIFNAVSNITYDKFYSNLNSYWNIRKESDRLCKAHNLSVIEKPRGKGMNHKEWAERKAGTSWKAALQITIDKNIKLAKNFSEFIGLMEKDKYEVKQGKHIAFRAEGQERFARAKNLGENYTQERIEQRIAETKQTRAFTKVSDRVYKGQIEKSSKKLLDLASVLMVKNYLEEKRNIKQRMFARSGRKANIQKISNQILYLRDNNINNGAELRTRIEQLQVVTATNRAKLKDAENALSKEFEAVRYIHTYQKYEEIYKQLQKTPFKKSFRERHQAELLIFENAKDKLQGMGINISGDIQAYVNLANYNKEKVNELNNIYKSDNKELETLLAIRDEIGRNKKQTRPVKNKNVSLD